MPEPADPATAATAKTLILWSRILGWGGLLLLLGGTLVAGAAFGGTAAGLTAGGGFLCAVAGAVIGQVGRAMQGRVL